MISVGRNIGGSVGISLVQALLVRREQFHQARLVVVLPVVILLRRTPLEPEHSHQAQPAASRGG